MFLLWALDHIIQLLIIRIGRSGISKQQAPFSDVIDSVARKSPSCLSEKVVGTTTSSTITAKPVPTFLLFPNLPPELRLQIWLMALPPRQGREIGPKSITSNHSNPLPQILWANRESRSLAIQANNYSIRSPTIMSLLPHQGKHFSYIVDYELDIFIFRDMLNFLHYTSALLFYGEASSFAPLKQELGRIRNLKIVERRGDAIAELVEKYLRLVLPIFEGMRGILFEIKAGTGGGGIGGGRIGGGERERASVLKCYKGRWEEQRGREWVVPILELRGVEVD